MFANYRLWMGCLVFCGLAALATDAPAQDIGDILNQITGGSDAADAEAGPPSAIDLLSRDSVADTLDLNNGQRQQAKDLIEGYKKQIAEIEQSYAEKEKAITSIRDRLRARVENKKEISARTDELKAGVEKSLLELLTDPQRAEFLKLSPASLPAEAPAETAAPASSSTAGGSGDSRSRPSGTSSSFPSRTRPSATTAKSEPARRTENTVASFDAGAVAQADAATPAGGDNVNATNAKPNPAAARKPVEKLSFNFSEAPWTDVIKLFVKAAALNLNMRDIPPGSFTYYDSQQYTPTQALDIMNRMLMQEGYILVRHDRFLSVFDISKGIPPNLVDTVTPDDLDDRGDTELLRVAFPLGDHDATKLSSEIGALLGSQGKVSPLSQTNHLVVTDIASNLRRVKKMIEPPPKLTDTTLTFKAFPLTQIDANEAAEIIRSLLGVQQGVTNVSEGAPNNNSNRGNSRGGSSGRGGSNGGGFDPRAMFAQLRGGGDNDDNNGRGNNQPNQPAAAAAQQAKVAVDYRTNSVLVHATAANMKLVEQMIEAVDVSPTNIAAETLRNAREPYFEVYKLAKADPSEASKTLTALHPGMVVNEDERNRMLHIFANAEKHKEIAAQIRQLDGGGTSDNLAVLPLEGLNGYDVSTTVAGLYANEPDSAPSVQIDPSGRNVIVRGDPAQIQMVRSMIERLAEFGPYEGSGGRTIQIVGTGAASSDLLRQAIPQVFPQATFTAATLPTNNNNNSRTSRNGSSRATGSSSEDADRAQRINDFRQRFFGGGDSGNNGGGFNGGGFNGGGFNRGGSTSGGGSTRGGRGGR